MALPVQRSILVAVLVCAAAAFACGASAGDAAKKDDKAAKKEAAAPVPPAAPTGTTPIAMVGDKAITLADLALLMLNQQEFDARKQALDALINEQLLDKEAAARGVNRQKLMETEVTSKVADATQKEIDDFYEQNKTRMGGQTKEQMAAAINTALKSQKQGDLQRAMLASLREKYAVKVMMEPPRIDVSLDDDAAKGPAKAPVTIVEFSDYQCPYCSRAETTVQDVLKKYGDKVRLVYRDYPLPFHQNAHTAAEASECAKEQGKFWEMHGAMFANQQKLAAADLVEAAGGIGIDKEKFKTCLDSGKFKAEVDKDMQDGNKYGVTGTPTFFINGIKIVGARDVNSFAEIIDAELAKSK
ncbi:MAG TPA: thioredoxin domain-containing protein [Candidatus Polarisedimenticolia bacterium]|nr:thioredoxin domain-containing protein [Candidatus Polarisedimenticolia bacterium]